MSVTNRASDHRDKLQSRGFKAAVAIALLSLLALMVVAFNRGENSSASAQVVHADASTPPSEATAPDVDGGERAMAWFAENEPGVETTVYFSAEGGLIFCPDGAPLYDTPETIETQWDREKYGSPLDDPNMTVKPPSCSDGSTPDAYFEVYGEPAVRLTP